jgi:tetratricopeptide (TPR) repeat protein
VRDYRAALAATEAASQHDPTSNRQVRFRGRVLAEVGRLADAKADLDLALELAREQGASSQLALTHLCYGIYAHLIGDPDLERIHGWQALEIADRTKDLFARAHGLFILGEGHLRRGRWKEAVEAIQESLDTSRQPEMNLHIEPGALGLLAEAYLGQGDRDLALKTAEQAVASEGPDLLHALLAMARVLIALGDADSLVRAGAVLDEAAAFVQSSGASSWEPLILLERGALAAARGEAQAEKAQLEAALQLFDEIGATRHADQLRRRLNPES